MAEEKKEAPKAEAGKGKEGGEADAKPASSRAPAKKGLNKKVLIIAGIVVADIALMAGLGLFIVGKMKKPAGPDPAVEALKKQEEEVRKAREEATRIGHVLPKPLPFTVNINGADGESHFLKCAINLEWEGAHGAADAGGGGHGAAPGLDATGQEIEKRMPKISDIIINILSSQSYEDLMKPSGKQRIKEAIVHEINAILPEPPPPAEGGGKAHAEGDDHGAGHHGGEGKIRNAFFTEFIVQ